MKLAKLRCYTQEPDCGVTNEYPTPEHSFKEPSLHMVVGQRTAGKSYLTSKILAQAKTDKTFDRIYIVTPSFNSNQSYFGKYINDDDVFEPTKESISNVISSVESDRVMSAPLRAATIVVLELPPENQHFKYWIQNWIKCVSFDLNFTSNAFN